MASSWRPCCRSDVAVTLSSDWCRALRPASLVRTSSSRRRHCASRRTSCRVSTSGSLHRGKSTTRWSDDRHGGGGVGKAMGRTCCPRLPLWMWGRVAAAGPRSAPLAPAAVAGAHAPRS